MKELFELKAEGLNTTEIFAARRWISGAMLRGNVKPGQKFVATHSNFAGGNYVYGYSSPSGPVRLYRV